MQSAHNIERKGAFSIFPDSGKTQKALDSPSGVDTTSGTIHDPAIRATATMTLALPKVGLFADGVERQTGDLYLADISVASAVWVTSRM